MSPLRRFGQVPSYSLHRLVRVQCFGKDLYKDVKGLSTRPIVLSMFTRSYLRRRRRLTIFETDETKFAFDPHTNRQFNNQLTKEKRHKNLVNKTIADRLRTVSLSNNSHPIGVDKPVYWYRTYPLITKAGLSKGQTFKNEKINNCK